VSWRFRLLGLPASLPNGLLLGFGKEANVSETVADGQFAWFRDCSSRSSASPTAAVRASSSVVMGKRGSDSALLQHPTAFSALRLSDSLSTLAIPARIHDGTPSFTRGPASYYP
jgi:hypothetical protein